MKKICNAIEILDYCSQCSLGTVLFFDVDNTLITPVSKAFRQTPNFIDEMKGVQNKIPNLDNLISHWRLNRKVRLVDPAWPEILSRLQQQYAVYGLTKVDTGTYGVIPSMEIWRAKELQDFGLSFSPAKNLEEHSRTRQQELNSPVFYQGIFMTGNASKADTLKLFQPVLPLKALVLVDDRLEQLESMADFCHRENIRFTGIHYTGMEQFTDLASPEVVAFQRAHLLAHGIWLEDEAVEALIRARNNPKK